jgi:Tol biopolymer transport system component
MAWSPDGRFIYYVERPSRTSEADELWRVPSAGGPARKLLSFPAQIWHLRIDPTGRYLSFGSETDGWNRREGPEPPPSVSPEQIAREWGKEYVLDQFLPESELRPASGR